MADHPKRADASICNPAVMTVPPIIPGPQAPGPEPAAQYLPAAPAPRKKGLSNGAIIAIIFGSVAVLGLVLVVCLGGVLAGGLGGNAAAADEISIASCGATAAGNMVAELRVENKSKSDKTYFITVEFVSGNERLGDGHIVINDLHPGQSTHERAIALVQSNGHFSCRVTDVNRY